MLDCIFPVRQDCLGTVCQVTHSPGLAVLICQVFHHQLQILAGEIVVKTSLKIHSRVLCFTLPLQRKSGIDLISCFQNPIYCYSGVVIAVRHVVPDMFRSIFRKFRQIHPIDHPSIPPSFPLLLWGSLLLNPRSLVFPSLHFQRSWSPPDREDTCGNTSKQRLPL